MELYLTYENRGVQPWRTPGYFGFRLAGAKLYGLEQASERLLAEVGPSGLVVDGSRYAEATILPHFANQDLVHAYLPDDKATSIRGFSFRWHKEMIALCDLHTNAVFAHLAEGRWWRFEGGALAKRQGGDVLILPTARYNILAPAPFVAEPRRRPSQLAERTAATV